MTPNTYFENNAESIARDLVGTFLCRRTDTETARFQITETEGYLGEDDTASHARFGRTDRSEIMYGPAGTLYVYLVYGMHHMLNIVTGAEDEPHAVLIRGIKGADGPGKLTNKLDITKNEHNGKMLGKESGIWIEQRSDDFSTENILAAPRIGIDYADDEWKEKPLRFIWAPLENK